VKIGVRWKLRRKLCRQLWLNTVFALKILANLIFMKTGMFVIRVLFSKALFQTEWNMARAFPRLCTDWYSRNIDYPTCNNRQGVLPVKMGLFIALCGTWLTDMPCSISGNKFMAWGLYGPIHVTFYFATPWTQGGISKIMQALGPAAMSRLFQHTYQRKTGTCWEGRFKSCCHSSGWGITFFTASDISKTEFPL